MNHLLNTKRGRREPEALTFGCYAHGLDGIADADLPDMRGPVLALYASAHGATATGVGLIIGAHMAAAALGSIPLGRASDLWGRRPMMLAAMAVSVVTSLLLPLFEGELALLTIYGVAGLAVAAFTPSALSLVGDAAPADGVGRMLGTPRRTMARSALGRCSGVSPQNGGGIARLSW